MVTIIFGIAGFMGIFMFLINKRIDSIEKRIDDLREDMKELKQEIRGFRELLYKVLGVEASCF